MLRPLSVDCDRGAFAVDLSKGGNPLDSPPAPPRTSSVDCRLEGYRQGGRSRTPPRGGAGASGHARSRTPAGGALLEGAALADADLLVEETLNRFFGDSTAWERVRAELARSPVCVARAGLAEALRIRFQVKVPQPYPGVQYRRSKRLDDRLPRYADNGMIVAGHLEDDGQWLRLGQDLYLPAWVGEIRILEELPPEGPSGWFNGCRSNSVDEASEVRVRAKQVIQDSQQSSVEQAATDCSRLPVDYPAAGARQVRQQDAAVTGPARAIDFRSGDTADVAALREAVKSAPGLSQRAAPPRDAQQQSGALPAEGGSLRTLPKADRNPLLSEAGANQRFTDPINPFGDTPPRSPADSPTRGVKLTDASLGVSPVSMRTSSLCSEREHGMAAMRGGRLTAVARALG